MEQRADHKLDVNCVPLSDRGDTEPLNPAGDEGGCAAGGGDATERYSFRPACGPVNYCEEVGKPRRLRKGTHQVDMHMFKTALRNGDGCWREMYMT
jgi:hypothetical protein